MQVSIRTLRHDVEVEGESNNGFVDDDVLQLVNVGDTEDHTWKNYQSCCTC